MGFMQRQIEHGKWYEIDGCEGTEFIPYDLVGDVDLTDFDGGEIPAEFADYCRNTEATTIEIREGWGARLSAPGYMDCTDWSVYDTEAEATESLEEMFGDDDDDSSE